MSRNHKLLKARCEDLVTDVYFGVAMSAIITTYYKTPVGELILGSYGDKLCLCDWRYRKMRAEVDDRVKKYLQAEYEEGASAINDIAIQQIAAYFKGECTEFAIPLLFAGTEFQQKVWGALLQVPYGTTATYLGLSAQLGNTKAIRAVAAANGANAISIIVPCHRIIGSSGELIGYAGGVKAKQALLELEQGGNGQMELF